MNTAYRWMSAAAVWTLAGVAMGQTVSVGTSSSTTASYGGVSQTAGPFPWTDLGVSATASVAQGDLSINTGGSTAFSLTTAVTAGETLGPATVFNVNYTPGWTGAFSQTAATGNLTSNFVYNIGPLSGSAQILNIGLGSSGASGADLSSSLNSPTGPAVTSSASGAGPSANPSFTLQAQACVVVCATIASASVGINIGTQVQQSVTVTPTVTYGDLVWISTTPTSHYSASDPQAFITGSNGKIANPLGNLTSLGLTTGQAFYYNFMPEVVLNLSLTSQAQLSLPAAITASYNVFGIGGSESFPLGNLYTLNTGADSYDVGTTFHNNNYYSIKMDYEPGAFGLAGPVSQAVVAGDYTGLLQPLGNDTLPPGTGPCAAAPVGCAFVVPGSGGAGILSGYGTQKMGIGPLIPGDQGPGDACAPAGTPDAGSCINHVILTGGTATAPEIDAASGASALTLLMGSLMVMRGRRRQVTGFVKSLRN